jgi:protoporphyrinogen oxidase
MRPWKVGIVGGGPGGLMTAHSLQKQATSAVRITLFEASSRLGGKILTPRFDSEPVRYEAGAAEFYDYSAFDDDPLKELIAELGLPISPMGGPAVISDHRVLANLDDIRDQLGPSAHRALIAFDRQAKDSMTPREFYHSDDPDGAYPLPDSRRFDSMLAEIAEPQARRLIEHLIHSDLATEPCRTSVAYGLQNYLMNDPAYMQLYGIVGGNEQLPRALAERLAADIRLEHCVTNVSRSDTGQLRITSLHQETTRTEEFDFVIICLPHNQIPSLSFPEPRLAAAIQSHLDYYNYPAHYLRVTMLFTRPFWRGTLNDSYWMLDRFGGCCLYDESARDPLSTRGVLGWLLGGDMANEASQWSDERLVAEALDSLPAFLSAGRDELIEARVHRWVAAVNAMPGGLVAKNLDRRHQPEPQEHGRLFLVGDYLFDSTLNGVLDSAEYVSAWIAAEMADETCKG